MNARCTCAPTALKSELVNKWTNRDAAQPAALCCPTIQAKIRATTRAPKNRPATNGPFLCPQTPDAASPTAAGKQPTATHSSHSGSHSTSSTPDTNTTREDDEHEQPPSLDPPHPGRHHRPRQPQGTPLTHRYCIHHGIVTTPHHCGGRWANGGTHTWRKQRAMVLALTPMCTHPHCNEQATEVHHVDDTHLAAVCRKHNPRGGETGRHRAARSEGGA
jgi:hypothetical protein